MKLQCWRHVSLVECENHPSSNNSYNYIRVQIYIPHKVPVKICNSDRNNTAIEDILLSDKLNTQQKTRAYYFYLIAEERKGKSKSKTHILESRRCTAECTLWKSSATPGSWAQAWSHSRGRNGTVERQQRLGTPKFRRRSGVPKKPKKQKSILTIKWPPKNKNIMTKNRLRI